ncbi:ketopantoate reductase family protein [Chloroflexota bacterium]
MKRMAVLGAGAIGSVLGGYIAKAGEDITLIDTSWREHVAAIQQHGLKISGARGESVIPVKALFIDELSQLEGRIDILFLAVKSYDTEEVLNIIEPYLAEDAWVVSCQNSINEDVISQIVGESNTIGCTVTFGSALWEPGHVVETREATLGFTVGELDGRITPRIKEIARITGLCNKTIITESIWNERWRKLAGNSMGNPLTAISGAKMAELLKNDKARRITARIAVEIIDIAEALGYNLESLSWISTEMWKSSRQGWVPEIDDILTERAAGFAGGWSSMLQDTIKGRKTEIDYLNGYVVRKGKEVGVPAPVNEIIVGVVRGVEGRQIKPGMDKIEALYNLIT